MTRSAYVRVLLTSAETGQDLDLAITQSICQYQSCFLTNTTTTEATATAQLYSYYAFNLHSSITFLYNEVLIIVIKCYFIHIIELVNAPHTDCCLLRSVLYFILWKYYTMLLLMNFDYWYNHFSTSIPRSWG